MTAEPFDPSDATLERRRDQVLAWKMALAVFVVATAVFCISPVITNYDSFATFPTAVSLVNRHTLSLDAFEHLKVLATSYTVSHTNGHLLTSYPWAVGLFAVPAVVVIDLVHALGGPSADSVVTNHAQTVQVVQLVSASIVTGLACGALALLAYRRLQGPAKERRHWALLCGLVFAFATSAWSTASRSLWQHGPSILLLAVALVALDQLFPRNTGDHSAQTDSTWAPLVAGLALAGAVTMRPTNAVALCARNDPGSLEDLTPSEGRLCRRGPGRFRSLGAGHRALLRNTAPAVRPGDQARTPVDLLRIRRPPSWSARHADCWSSARSSSSGWPGC